MGTNALLSNGRATKGRRDQRDGARYQCHFRARKDLLWLTTDNRYMGMVSFAILQRALEIRVQTCLEISA